MKKAAFILFLFLLISARPALALSPDGRTTTMGPVARVGYSMMRGVANAVGLPFEISGTIRREYGMHSHLWPITWMPRFLANVCVRVSSITHDLLFSPFVAPFSNDLSPVTEGFGLPEYPWQKE